MTIHHHYPHRDQQFFDEVHITAVPRYKESELSGDEWRYSALVLFKYKGQIIKTFSFRNVATAIEHANTMMMLTGESLDYDRLSREMGIETCCDQEGCDEQATEYFQIKNLYNDCGTKRLPLYDKIPFRKFCKRHSRRGDCGLEDADDNYSRIEKPETA